jgi:antirestriction protein ArdC
MFRRTLSKAGVAPDPRLRIAGAFHGEARGPCPSLGAALRYRRPVFAAIGADIRHGGARAYYAEGLDYVQMPPFETFRNAESYITPRRSRMSACLGRNTQSAWRAI